jgi:type II secretory pathway pseudopilin PulG
MSQHRIWTVGIGVIGLVALLAAVAAGLWYFVLRTPSTRVDLSQALRQYQLAQKGKQGAAAGQIPSGVYRYATSGSEHLSFGGISRSFPPTSEMIVTNNAGCSTMKWEPIEQHIEGLVVCPSGHGSLSVRSASSFEDIAGSATTSTITCPAGAYYLPPTSTIGHRWQVTCHSPGDTVRFSGQIMSPSLVDVGKTSIPAAHVRIVFSFSGSESGLNPNDYWVSAHNGLVLRQSETVNVSQKAGPLGSVHYAETMAISLKATSPTR